jgi:hypothetical protein
VEEGPITMLVAVNKIKRNSQKGRRGREGERGKGRADHCFEYILKLFSLHIASERVKL